jgi:galactitol-specific phosphotransferase system IIB component
MSQAPTSKLQSVSDMKKAELQQELNEWNIIYSSKDTVPELHSAVTHSRKERDIQTSKEPGPSHGLSGMTKMEFQQMCRERGIPVGSHHTNGNYDDQFDQATHVIDLSSERNRCLQHWSVPGNDVSSSENYVPRLLPSTANG